MHFSRRCANIFRQSRDAIKNPGVAKFGIALEWGSRGLEFESRHSDQIRKNAEIFKGFQRFSLYCSMLIDFAGNNSFERHSRGIVVIYHNYSPSYLEFVCFFVQNIENNRNVWKKVEYIYIYIIVCAEVLIYQDTHTFLCRFSQISEQKKQKEAKVMKKTVAIILAFVLGLSLAACGQSTSTRNAKAETNTPIAAKYDGDGIAYIPLMSGNAAKIDNDVFRSAATPDRTRIVVLTKDGILYFTDADQTTKTQVTDKGDSIQIVADEGILYTDSDGDYHRYLFADGSDVNIGKVDTYKQSETGFNVAFAVDSSLYVFAGSAQEKEKIGNIVNSCKFLYVSNDGKTVYWNDYEDYEETVFISVDGDKTKIGAFETSSKYTATAVTYNASNKFAVVTNYNSDTLFIVSETGEPLKNKLGNELASSTVFTKTGLLSRDTSTAFSGIYVTVEGSDGDNLYYIDAGGEREKVLSKIGAYAIYDNYLYYIDEDNNFKTAKIAEATLSGEEKITGDVEIMYSASNNGYIYFVKDLSSTDATGILYAYKKGSDPVKVASDASCSEYWGFWLINGSNSSDGKTIYFYKDSTDIKDTYNDYAVLYKYTYGDAEPTKIASDVVVGSINSGYTSGLINNNSFIYLKYSSVKDEDVIGDWYYFNGTDSSKMATDVIY